MEQDDKFRFVEQITRAHFLVLGSPFGRAKGALQLCHMSQQHKETERIRTDALR